jgi:phosphoglycolate phosphatase-like HAD superfamily hydrolase
MDRQDLQDGATSGKFYQLMTSYAKELIDFRPGHGFFIGIDSDGCAFDTMEIKQKQCFLPNNIKFFGLESIADYAKEATEFVNLYSKERGSNRYPAILSVLSWLSKRREVIDQGVKVPDLKRLRKWVQEGSQLSKSVLRALVEKTGDSELRNVLAWSEAVDATIEAVVKGVQPFPWVRESLEKAFAQADIMVVSQTPLEALEREWTEHDLIKFVRVIAGQEHGTKTEHIALAAKGKYPADKIMMIGDAQGDYRAAAENGICFFPIVPGKEEASWQRFLTESLEKFWAGTYKGQYEAALIKEFDAALPDTPRWG